MRNNAKYCLNETACVSFPWAEAGTHSTGPGFPVGVGDNHKRSRVEACNQIDY